MPPNVAPDPTLAAYEATAPVYDAFTAHHDYEAWVAAIEKAAKPSGLRVGAMLDVGCGTGKSFRPFLRRGWRVSACDISPTMLARARTQSPADVDLFEADFRALPSIGRFELVLALDDVVNYVEPERVRAAFGGVAANLASNGLFIFDANTQETYRTFFANAETRDLPDLLVLWQGKAPRDFGPGGTAEGFLDAFRLEADGRWTRATARHLQYHHPIPDLRAALEEAGLEPVGIFGQCYDANFEQPPDEDRHTKVVFIARRKAAPNDEGR